MATKMYSILPYSVIVWVIICTSRGNEKNACQILMENLEGTENFFGDNDIKEKILWKGILREIKRLNST